MSSAKIQTDAPSTREALLEAGRSLLLSREKFSMGTVGKQAGVSRQAVYLHFADRYALLDAIVQAALDAGGAPEGLQRIHDAPSADAGLTILVEVMVGLTVAHGALEHAVRAVLASDKDLAERWAARGGRRRAIASAVDRLVDEGRIRPELDREAAVDAAYALTGTEVLLRLLERGDGPSVSALVERSVRAAILTG